MENGGWDEMVGVVRTALDPHCLHGHLYNPVPLVHFHCLWRRHGNCGGHPYNLLQDRQQRWMVYHVGAVCWGIPDPASWHRHERLRDGLNARHHDRSLHSRFGKKWLYKKIPQYLFDRDPVTNDIHSWSSPYLGFWVSWLRHYCRRRRASRWRKRWRTPTGWSSSSNISNGEPGRIPNQNGLNHHNFISLCVSRWGSISIYCSVSPNRSINFKNFPPGGGGIVHIIEQEVFCTWQSVIRWSNI